MNQHPIPQNVTQYQFRLIGDMTIKQFLFLIAGLGLGFLAYNAPLLPALFRWPVAILCAFAGAAVAFLPINERPMSEWLTNFAKAIYAPTHFYWQKQALIPEYMSYQPKSNVSVLPPLPQTKDRGQLNTFVNSLQNTNQNQFDKLETNKLQTLDSLFKSSTSGMQTPKTSSSTLSITNQPPAGNKPRMIKTHPTQHQINTITQQASQVQHHSHATPNQTSSQTPPTPTTSQTAQVQGVVYTTDTRIPNAVVEIITAQGQTVRTTKTNNQGAFSFPLPLSLGQYHIHAEHPQFQIQQQPLRLNTPGITTINLLAARNQQESTPMATFQLPPSLNQPTTITSNIQHLSPKPRIQPQSMPSASGPMIQKATPLSPPIKIESNQAPPPMPKPQIQQPRYVTDIQMPIAPETPNTIIGMTLTPTDQLIDNAIVEIKDKNNFPLRTVKTNNLGQFFIATPLNNGKYTILAEHNNYKFKPMNLDIAGKIIPPIKLVSD